MSLTDLKRICEEATPGPWLQVIHPWHSAVECDIAHGLSQNEITPHVRLMADSEFIATFNPAFVAKLLAVVEAAKKLQHYSRHGANEGWSDWDKYFDPTMKAVDALEDAP